MLEIKLFYYLLNIIIPFCFYSSLFLKTEGFKTVKMCQSYLRGNHHHKGAETDKYSVLLTKFCITRMLFFDRINLGHYFLYEFFFHLPFSLNIYMYYYPFTQCICFKRWTDLHYTNCRHEITCFFSTLSNFIEW